MEARNGSDPHRSGSKMPGIGETDFPTFQMLFTASMMRYDGVNEALETEIPEDESAEEAALRMETHRKGNKKAYSYLVECCLGNKTAILIIRSVTNRDKTDNLCEFNHERAQGTVCRTCRRCSSKIDQ